MRRMNTLTSNATSSLIKRGASASAGTIIGRSLARFLKFYVAKRGFREGRAGLIVAAIEAHSVLLKYAKLWEVQSKKPDTTSVDNVAGGRG